MDLSDRDSCIGEEKAVNSRGLIFRVAIPALAATAVGAVAVAGVAWDAQRAEKRLQHSNVLRRRLRLKPRLH